MKKISDRLAKLIDVKSIVTLVLTLVFALTTITGKVSMEQFLTIFTVVIAFYFGTQTKKGKGEQPYDNKLE